VITREEGRALVERGLGRLMMLSLKGHEYNQESYYD
jgi:hypothetical protein